MQAERAEELVSGRIVRDMSDGVMVIDTSGQIIEFNPAAARILGMNAGAVLGSTFAEHFLLLPNDDFNQVVLDAIYDASTTHNRVVEFRPDADAEGGDAVRVLSLTTSFLVDGADAGQRIGVIVVFGDVTELRAAQAATERLGAELQDKHRQLQAAYRETEARNEALQAAVRKVQVIRSTATVFSITLFVGLGFYAWSRPAAVPVLVPPTAAALPQAGGLFTVVPAQQVEKLSLSGKVRPLRTINISAPFAGRIGELAVDYGQRVEPGQLLLRMDDTEAAIRHREAQAAAIKAQAAHRELENWQSGAEMARARRLLTRAQMALDAQGKLVEETQRLFDKGIVPASELDSARERLESLQLDLANAREELEAVRLKGESRNLEVARMEMTNAEVKAAQRAQDLANAQVRATVAGLVMLPVQEDSRNGGAVARALEIGRSVQQDEALLAIGDLTGLAVTLRVDEIDITRLNIGMRARVGFDAFPGVQLDGRLEALSQNAEKSSSVTTFDATVVIASIPAELRARLLMGMSANVDIFLRDAPDALMVPLSAVRSADGQHLVFRHRGAGQAAEAVVVRTGATTHDRVEILAGLQAGDVIEAVAPASATQEAR